jgi:hypothetical protein
MNATGRLEETHAAFDGEEMTWVKTIKLIILMT